MNESEWIQNFSGMDFTAPMVPDSGLAFMPSNTSELSLGVWEILKKAIGIVRPDLAEACSVCLGILAVVILVSIIHTIPGAHTKTVDLAGSVGISGIFLGTANAMVTLANETIRQLSDYGRLLIPVMASTLAAEGGVSSAGALYAGTIGFDALLCGLIQRVLLPMIHVFLLLTIAHGALGEDLLKKLCGFVKWLSTWSLKLILYAFTGCLGITGVVSGTADAAALKMAKITISGVVPVVGGIMADASEAVLVSAGIVKQTAGGYGILAVIAVGMGPFLKIGIHYLLLKLTAALCAILSPKGHSELVGDFSALMGLLLAMTGAISLMLLISVVCFLKGVG